MNEEQLIKSLSLIKNIILWFMIFMTWGAGIVIGTIISLQVLGVMDENKTYPSQTIESDSAGVELKLNN
jgi:hypothetical protein